MATWVVLSGSSDSATAWPSEPLLLFPKVSPKLSFEWSSGVLGLRARPGLLLLGTLATDLLVLVDERLVLLNDGPESFDRICLNPVTSIADEPLSLEPGCVLRRFG